MGMKIGAVVIFAWACAGVSPAGGETVAEMEAGYLALKEDADLPRLRFEGRYLEQLDALGKRAREAGDLDLAVAVEAEKAGFRLGSKPAEDPELRRLQGVYVREEARLRAEKRAALAGLMRGYGSQLAGRRDELTRAGKLSEAEEVHRVVKELEAEVEALAKVPPPLVIDAVTKDRAYVNSLGMEFVPVPLGKGAGARLLVCRWETRVDDFSAYAEEVPEVGVDWKDVMEGGVGQVGNHPVVNVSWEDAGGFCRWLTGRERAEGVIPQNATYRLPTDHEWSCAVGIGHLEDAEAAPAAKGGRLAGFPWGAGPTRHVVGNYGDESAGKAGLKKRGEFIPGYDDGYAFTAPVGQFRANEWGLFDLGGNVAEWCEDAMGSGRRVLRGASWSDYKSAELLSSYRRGFGETWRGTVSGFRCVLAVPGG